MGSKLELRERLGMIFSNHTVRHQISDDFHSLAVSRDRVQSFRVVSPDQIWR